jgi:hypothetical protein
MNCYYALKPLRFDKSYSIGEPIAEDKIDPRIVKRLIKQGKISERFTIFEAVIVDSGQAEPPNLEPDTGETGQQESGALSPNPEPDTNESEPQDGKSDSGSETYTCNICGRAYAARSSLLSHMKRKHESPDAR